MTAEISSIDLLQLSDSFGTPIHRNGVAIFNYDANQSAVTIRSSGKFNILVLPTIPLSGKLHVDFRSERSCVVVESHTARANILIGYGSVLYIGENSTFSSPANFILFEEKDIFVGRYAMFAENVTISNTDGHPIFDRDQKRINYGRDVIIGEHVWLGRGSEILKGAVVQSGATVGARSLVTSEIPPNAICVGVPARVIAQDTYFERKSTVHMQSCDAPLHFKLFSPLDLSNYPHYQAARTLVRS